MGEITPGNEHGQLTDISKRSNFKEIAAKGGRSKSIKKKVAAKERWIMARLKDNGLKNGDVKWLVERVKNREVMGTDLLRKIDDIYKDPNTENKTLVLKTMTEIGKFIHGDKIKTENVNINIDMKMEPEEQERLMEFIRGDK